MEKVKKREIVTVNGKNVSDVKLFFYFISNLHGNHCTEVIK
jgi:hypothetical protein